MLVEIAVGAVVVGAVVRGVGAWRAWRGRRELADRVARTLAAERAALELALDALSSHIADLVDEVEIAPAERGPEARPFYDAAVAAYGEARDALPALTECRQVERVRNRIADGVTQARIARATIDGRPAPPSETPLLEGLCAFDPAHGRAVRQMEITTPSGSESTVPVCAACGDGLAAGQPPPLRTLTVNGTPIGYWQVDGMLGSLHRELSQMGIAAALDGVFPAIGSADARSVTIRRVSTISRDGTVITVEDRTDSV